MTHIATDARIDIRGVPPAEEPVAYGATARVISTSYYLLEGVIDGYNGTVSPAILYRVIDGVSVALGQSNPVSNTAEYLGLECIGSTINCYSSTDGTSWTLGLSVVDDVLTQDGDWAIGTIDSEEVDFVDYDDFYQPLEADVTLPIMYFGPYHADITYYSWERIYTGSPVYTIEDTSAYPGFSYIYRTAMLVDGVFSGWLYSNSITQIENATLSAVTGICTSVGMTALVIGTSLVDATIASTFSENTSAGNTTTITGDASVSSGIGAQQGSGLTADVISGTSATIAASQNDSVSEGYSAIIYADFVAYIASGEAVSTGVEATLHAEALILALSGVVLASGCTARGPNSSRKASRLSSSTSSTNSLEADTGAFSLSASLHSIHSITSDTE